MINEFLSPRIRGITLILFSFVFISAGVSPGICSELDVEVQNAQAYKVILKFNGKELKPARLTMNKIESSVFFVNSSTDSAVNLKIDFRGKALHCHSKNLKLDSDGFLRTINPIKSFDFGVLCFPLVGSYSFTVTEVSGKKREFRGEVVVNE